jgi:Holliday junction resolvasome RuvABC ATP-dependent DNA helicase subunit
MPEVVFESYTFSDLRAIAQKVGEDEGVEITSQAAGRIAEVAAGSKESTAGTPRRVGQLVDELVLHLPEKSTLGKEDVDFVFGTILGIDRHGLWPKHRRYLLALRPGPCSLYRLAILLGQEPADLAEEVEPLLFTLGFIEVSSKQGRMLKEKGRQVVDEMAPLNGITDERK